MSDSKEVSAITATVGQLMSQVEALKIENDRLRAESHTHWETRSAKNELAGKLTKAENTIEQMRDETNRLRNANEFWRKAVRYEQCSKARVGQPRHLPIYNSVIRAGQAGWSDRQNRERVFLRHWRRENKRVSGTNGGYGCLELILSNDSNSSAADITQRDATVAATVIQWLGTNCGQSFLFEVQRDIDRKKPRVAIAS